MEVNAFRNRILAVEIKVRSSRHHLFVSLHEVLLALRSALVGPHCWITCVILSLIITLLQWMVWILTTFQVGVLYALLYWWVILVDGHIGCVCFEFLSHAWWNGRDFFTVWRLILIEKLLFWAIFGVWDNSFNYGDLASLVSLIISSIIAMALLAWSFHSLLCLYWHSITLDKRCSSVFVQGL